MIVGESDNMEANNQNKDDPDEGSVNGKESTTKDKKKPKGWKDIPKTTSKTSAALNRKDKTKNELLNWNYTGKKIKHFQIIVMWLLSRGIVV